jgi:Protein of unknown function (DUF2846)
MKAFVCLALLLTLSAAGFAQAPVQTGQTVTKTDVTANKDATATLVFYRPKRFYGSGLTPSVFVNGEEVARMDNGRYFVLAVKPGTIKLSSSMKHDPTPTEVTAGKVQYFEMAILTGTWKGGGRLIPTSAADAQEALKKLKPLDQKWAKSDQVSFVLPGEATADAK